jgi:hypothetical protein
VSVVVSEVKALPSSSACTLSSLADEEQLVGHVVLWRQGRLFPRRAARDTATACRDEEPVWRFDEELVFDDPALLARRGKLQCTLMIKRRSAAMSRVLAYCRGIPVPSQGEVTVKLLDGLGTCQGEARICTGWQCSAALARFVSQRVQLDIQTGRWEEARALLVSGAEAAEAVAAASDDQGRTALMWAARHPEGTAFVKDLLALGAAALTDAVGASAAHYGAVPSWFCANTPLAPRVCRLRF